MQWFGSAHNLYSWDFISCVTRAIISLMNAKSAFHRLSFFPRASFSFTCPIHFGFNPSFCFSRIPFGHNHQTSDCDPVWYWLFLLFHKIHWIMRWISVGLSTRFSLRRKLSRWILWKAPKRKSNHSVCVRKITEIRLCNWLTIQFGARMNINSNVKSPS